MEMPMSTLDSYQCNKTTALLCNWT